MLYHDIGKHSSHKPLLEMMRGPDEAPTADKAFKILMG